jgi:hypothetical protein
MLNTDLASDAISRRAEQDQPEATYRDMGVMAGDETASLAIAGAAALAAALVGIVLIGVFVAWKAVFG